MISAGNSKQLWGSTSAALHATAIVVGNVVVARLLGVPAPPSAYAKLFVCFFVAGLVIPRRRDIWTRALLVSCLGAGLFAASVLRGARPL